MKTSELMEQVVALRAATRVSAETTLKVLDRLILAEQTLDNISRIIHGHDPDDWSSTEIEREISEYNQGRAS